MNLKDQISADMKAAMKEKNQLTLTVLRGLNATINNRTIEKRSKAGPDAVLTDEELQNVVLSEAKKRKESAQAFQSGSREDLATNELAELAVLQTYLPKQLTKEETAAIVTRIVASLPVKEFGPAMKAVMQELRGKADSAVVTELVKQAISS